MLLHETVAAWVRKYFRSHPMCWVADQDKNVAAFLSKLRECESYINQNYKGGDLAREFNGRIEKLIKEKGRRLKK